MARTDEVLKKVKEIELVTRRLVNDVMAGQYHAVFKGRGMSFDAVREYQPGDDVRLIDWNVTARAGEPFVKKFVEERELTVLIAVDLSASGMFGTIDQSKREMAAEIAATLAFSAIQNNDRVGLVLFSDRIERYIPPKKGRSHVLRVILELLEADPKGHGTDLGVACDYLSRIQRKRAVVFFLSDFLADDWGRPLGVAARRHDVVPIVVRDHAEDALPDVGLLPLEDAETGEVLWVDTSSRAGRRTWERIAGQQRKERERLLRRHGLEPIEATVGEPWLPALVGYFRRRAARQ
ncbi:MAG: hypothetical protein RIT45_2282 [Pseudomonadota bacterium]